MTDQQEPAPESARLDGLDVSRQGDLVRVDIVQAGRIVMTLQLSPNTAAETGALLLGSSGYELHDPRAFFEPPMISISNPALAIEKADTCALVMSVKGKGLRPIILQFSADRAAALRDALAAKLG